MERRVAGCWYCTSERLEPHLVAETRFLAAAAAPQPLRPGHLLVLPRAHLPSLAALPPEAGSELRDLLERLDALLVEELGAASGLEHAAPGENTHALLHLLPDLPDAIAAAARAAERLEASGPADLAEAARRWGGYLFLWRQGRGSAAPPGVVPAGGLRRWLVEALAARGQLQTDLSGRDQARHWRRGWQRLRRERGGPPQGIVTSFLRRDGRICILKRSAAVESAAGKWHGVSGYLPEGMDPLEQALEEVYEETGLAPSQLRLARAGSPVPLGEPPERPPWLVYPFLFDLLSGEPRLNWEHQELAWIDPAELPRYDTVPWLPLIFHALSG